MNQALLVIDAQRDMVDGSYTGQLAKKDAVLGNIKLALAKAEQANAQVVFIRDVDIAGGSGPGFEVDPTLPQPSGSVTIDTSHSNIFVGTLLGPFLKERGVEHVVMCGMQSEHSVDTAVREAVGRGYRVTLLEDAHSTVGSGVLSGSQIINHENETLYAHGDLENFCVTRSAAEDIFTPNHEAVLADWDEQENGER